MTTSKVICVFYRVIHKGFISSNCKIVAQIVLDLYIFEPELKCLIYSISTFLVDSPEELEEDARHTETLCLPGGGGGGELGDLAEPTGCHTYPAQQGGEWRHHNQLLLGCPTVNTVHTVHTEQLCDKPVSGFTE